MPPLILLAVAWLLIVNTAAFVAFASDKRRAVTGVQRIPERLLLQLTAVGGGVGGLAAQQAFRHKTRKQPFQTRFRAIIAVQLAAMLVVLVGAYGPLG